MAAVGLNAAVLAVTSLPIIPVNVVGGTPILAINQTQRDQVGWPTYARQVDAVARSTDRGDTIVLASNYGDAGALERYGSPSQPPIYSAHNALFDLGAPPDSTSTVVVVGGQYDLAKTLFAQYAVKTHLDNGVGVDTRSRASRSPSAPARS